MEDLITWDQSLFLYLNNLGNPEFDWFWIFVSNKWSWIPLYVFFLYLLCKNYQPKQVLYILLFLVLGVVVSDQLAGLFKFSIERFRPCHDAALQSSMRIVECGGKFGFYSSHASNTFLLAIFLGNLLRKYKYLPIFLLLWAVLVSYSRIYLGVHFPLDILVGTIMGVLIGKLMIMFVKKRL